MSKLDIYTGGPVETHGYILHSEQNSSEVLVIDAPEGIADHLKKQGLKAKFLLITHQHYDHVGDAAKLQEAGAEIISYQDYSKQLTLEAYGLPFNIKAFKVDQLVTDKEVVPLLTNGALLSLGCQGMLQIILHFTSKHRIGYFVETHCLLVVLGAQIYLEVAMSN